MTYRRFTLRIPCLLMIAFAAMGRAAETAPPITYFRGATLHRVSGAAIEDGVLGIQGDRIVYVGKSLEGVDVSQGTIVDVAGQHIYPGLIDADTSLGLVEIEAVRATVDTSEIGQLNPNAEAFTAFNPDSELIPVARADGILLALSTPRGDFVAGRSALMRLDGWHGTDMALRRDVGLHVYWPAAGFRPGPGSGPRGRRGEDRDPQERRRRQLEELEILFDDAAVYARQSAAGTATPNLRLEAVGPVLSGKELLFVHTDVLQGIREAVDFASRRGLKLVIVGGYDAPQAAELLKQHDAAVIVTGTQRLPRRASSPYDEPFRVPARLQAAGVRFCVSGNDRFSASAVRNLPQHAGTAAAFGLTPEQAVRSITLSPAEILGVADQVGSLDVGKLATFVVASGDILEIDTQISRALLDGREVDLDTRQKRLYRKYQERYSKPPVSP